MASNVSLSILASNTGMNLNSRITFGTQKLISPYTNHNQYWIVVIDRYDLSVKANFHVSNNNSVPAQLGPFMGNTQYIMILTTQNLGSNNLPTGPFYDFLISEGAGVQLKRAEQIYEAFGCASFGNVAYTLVSILGDDGGPAFEGSNFVDHAYFTTLELVAVDIAGKTIYTPASLS